MQQRSKEAKKAVVTPLMNHMATPSGFPQPRTLDSPLFVDRRLKKPLLQLEEVEVASMVLSIEMATAHTTKIRGEGFRDNEV
ncbi:hypothetical protein JHK82_048656 [Glycine max]|nr:hypothetical protein JHK82_048656 [Glycine max]